MYGQMIVNGTVELNAKSTFYYYLYWFTDVDHIKNMQKWEKFSPSNVGEIHKVNEKLQRIMQWNKSDENWTWIIYRTFKISA